MENNLHAFLKYLLHTHSLLRVGMQQIFFKLNMVP